MYKNVYSFTERALSAGLLPRVSSAVSLDPGSDESFESDRLQMRSASIPNGALFASDMMNLANNNFLGAIPQSPSGTSTATANSTHIHEKPKTKSSSGRRLSIKHNQLPIDSIC